MMFSKGHGTLILKKSKMDQRWQIGKKKPKANFSCSAFYLQGDSVPLPLSMGEKKLCLVVLFYQVGYGCRPPVKHSHELGLLLVVLIGKQQRLSCPGICTSQTHGTSSLAPVQP
jgi:hypothetical protein